MVVELMSSASKRCVFATANEGYVAKAIVSLLSFKKHNPSYDMYLLGPPFGREARSLCEAHDVHHLDLDLSADFHEQWEYPRECFYHFKGPEVFLPLGYDFSVYIDGDTYCNGPFPNISSGSIAGVSYDTVRDFFTEIQELDQIIERVRLPVEADFGRRRLQSGVLLLDNRALVDLGYFDKACRIYDVSIQGGVPRKGDDSLLALLLAAFPEIDFSVLPRPCNLIDFKRLELEKWDSEEAYSCVVYHFVNEKPWAAYESQGDAPHRYFRQKWTETMINEFSDQEIQRWFPELYKDDPIDADSVNFYWFTPQVNFGDWISPYLVKQATGRSLLRPTDPEETTEGVVLGAGSIMRLCGPNTVVWGSGIRDRRQDISPGRLIRSVRGPFTRRRVLEVGGECPPIFGDPGLLLPRFYTPAHRRTRYRLGVIPHVSQFETVNELYGDEEGVSVVDLRTKDVESVIDRIAACEAVVSSSLHGIVACNAYGIPVRWIQFDTNIFGDDTKYSDHFAAIGREGETFLDARRYKKLDVDDILDEIEPYEMGIDLDALWDASPFHDGEVSRFIRYILS